MKLKSKLILTLLTLSLGSQTLMALEIPKLETTFSATNIENTFNTSHGKATYIITNNNQVRAIGAEIWGAEVKESRKIWVDIIGVDGNALQNIVQVHTGATVVYMLDANGDVYRAHASSNYAEKVNLTNIVDISINPINTQVIALDTEGNVFTGTTGSFTQVKTDKKFKCIEAGIASPAGTYENGLVSEDGTLYTMNHSGVFTTRNVENVSKIIRTGQFSSINKYYQLSSRFYAITESGELYRENGSLIRFLEDNVSGTEVFPIVYDVLENNGDDSSYVITSEGVFKLKYSDSFAYRDTSLDFIPVAQGDSGAFYVGATSQPYVRDLTTIFMDRDGNLQVKGANLGNIFGMDTGINTSTYTTIKEDWMNNTNIMSMKDIYNFDIVPNSVNKREGKYTVDFKLVTPQKPTSISFYFAQGLETANQDKWKEIELNVPFDSLKPVEFDTGYLEGDGTPIKGYTYSYDWQLPNRNLVDISIIARPNY